MNYNNFPEQLRNQKQWVLWKKEMVKDKLTKVPYRNTAQHASSTKPETWNTFENCIELLIKFPKSFDGLGYVFKKDIVGIDLDHCFDDNNNIKDWAKKIVDLFPSYIEISPSGKGLHIFIVCKIDFKGAKAYIEDGDIERYVNGRYFTVTGNVYKEYNQLKQFQPDYFLQWHKSLIKEEPKKETQTQQTSVLLPEDSKILEVAFKSKHGARIKDLYEGNWQKHFKKEEKKSQSEADLSLVGSLMFFCGNNITTVDRIFKTSGLMRDKWDRKDIRDGIFEKAYCAEPMKWDIQQKEEKTIEQQNERESQLRASITSLKDFLDKQLPPNRWVTDSLIPEGMTILSSAPGQYKTYMLLALAKQISNGELAFNHFHTEKRNILFINEEMGENSMQSRLKTIAGEYGNLYMTNLAGVKLSDINVILKLCQEREITLVMFDSLTRIHSLKENDADDVKKIFEAMLALLKANISIVMTHHHRKTPMFGAKNGSEEMRGSIDILAQIDCHLAIDQVAIDKTYVVLKQLKIRIAENLPDFKIDIKKDKDDKISFVYKGNFSKSDEVNAKIAKNSEAILEIIKESPGLTKDDIIEKSGGQVSIMAVKAILLDLEKKDIVFCKTLKPKTYYIKDEISTLF